MLTTLILIIVLQINSQSFAFNFKISPITATPENDALPAETGEEATDDDAQQHLQQQLQVYRNGIGPRIESDHESQRTVSEDQLERVIAMERALPQPLSSSSSSSSSLTRNETRRSKSKVRSYLRRCKEVITGHHHSHNQEGIDHSLSSIASSHEPVIQRQAAVRPQHQHNDSPFQVIVHHEGEEEEQKEGQAPPPQKCQVLASVITSSCDDEDDGPTTITYNMEIGSEVSAFFLRSCCR